MHGAVDVVRLPYLTVQSLTHTISLMVVGTPSMPDKGAPLRHRAVDSFAVAKAVSASISEKALNRSCTCSARASVACATSSGVNLPELKPAVSSATPNRHSSFASARNRLFIAIPMCIPAVRTAFLIWIKQKLRNVLVSMHLMSALAYECAV